jgi:hypothetical protein
MVAAGPEVWAQCTVSPAYSGSFPVRTNEVLPSQKESEEADAPVTFAVGAGTVMVMVAEPLTQGPDTVHWRVYIPCIRFETDVLL